MATPNKIAAPRPERTLRKFHASGYKCIEELMVESESETMVTIGYDRLLDRVIRYKKLGREEGWFNTWEEAHAFLRKKVALEVKDAETCLRVIKQTEQDLLALATARSAKSTC
jgi:hypothetical protein